MERAKQVVPVSGLEVRVLVGELSALKGWYVSSVHCLGENQLIRMKSPGGDQDVVVSPIYGPWLTSAPAHGTTREFTTGLRQALERLKLEEVRQFGLDRVVSFGFTGGEKAVQLVVELIPPGNIVVTGTDGRISLCLKEYKGLRRTIVRGGYYNLPPPAKVSLDAIDEQSLGLVLSAEKTLGRALGRGLSLPRRYVDEILARTSMSQEEPAVMTVERQQQLLAAIRGLVTELSHPSPCIVEIDSKLELMSVRPVSGAVLETAEKMSALMDRIYIPSMVHTEDAPAKDQKSEEIEVTIRRLEEQAYGLKERAVLLRSLAGQLREAAAIEAASELVEASTLGDELKKELKGRSSVAAMSSRLYDEAKAGESEVVKIAEISGSLASKLKRAKKVAPKSTVRSVKREKKEWYEKFRWFFTSGDKLAVGGRDAQSNTILIKRHVDNGDVVYHADLFGSPFFVLKGGEGQSPDEVREVAQATAAFSSAWKTGLSAADSYWVMPDQVSGSAPSGEYLAKGSFAIKGKKNFVLRNPVELAIGIDSEGRMASGPEQAIMKTCRAYVVLLPSRDKSSDTAKKVLFELKKLYGEDSGAELDDVMRAMAAGGGKIVRRKERKDNDPAVAETDAAAAGQDY